jgi:HemY protein
MMRGVLTAVVTIAVTIALAWWIAGLAGSIDVTLFGTTLQTTTPIAVTLALIGLVVLALLARILIWIVTLPGRISGWRARRRRLAGDAAVTRTLVALAAGDARAAQSEAKAARRFLGDTAQTLLHAAEAARLAGQSDAAAELFRKLAARGDAGFLGLRGLFRQALAREDWDEAARLAREAELLQPGATWMRAERAELAVRTNDWARAQALAAPGTPKASFAVAALTDETDAGRALRNAKRAWKDNPDFTPAAVAYAARLQQAGRTVKALDVLRTAWRTAPHPDLAAQAIAPITNLELRLKEGMRLVQPNPSHPESHFLLARLALEANLPQEAREHADKARAAGMNQQRLWLLYADIEAAQNGDSEAARIAQRDALRHATIAEPDPGWRCETCGTAHATWLPACPTCHTPGHITWGLAPRPRLLASS